jgi:hypothetical protein
MYSLNAKCSFLLFGLSQTMYYFTNYIEKHQYVECQIMCMKVYFMRIIIILLILMHMNLILGFNQNFPLQINPTMISVFTNTRSLSLPRRMIWFLYHAKSNISSLLLQEEGKLYNYNLSWAEKSYLSYPFKSYGFRAYRLIYF